MRIKLRTLVVIASCLGAALALALSGHDNASVNVIDAIANNHSLDAQVSENQQPRLHPDTHFDLTIIKRTGKNNVRASGLFESKSWYIAPVPQPVSSNSLSQPSTLPPPPTFDFIGRMIDGDIVTLFLSQNDREYLVKVNDVLNETYRVDKITNSDVVLTYLPMNTQQTISFDSTAVGSSALSASLSNSTMKPIVPSRIQQKSSDLLATR